MQMSGNIQETIDSAMKAQLETTGLLERLLGPCPNEPELDTLEGSMRNVLRSVKELDRNAHIILDGVRTIGELVWGQETGGPAERVAR